MSIFSSIIDKIFHHDTPASPAPGATTGQPAAPPADSSIAASTQTAAAQPRPMPALQSVDVDAVLSKVALTKGGGGNWRTSIVDLLKLLDLDSSVAARKELAQELDVHAGADGSAEQNIALQSAVMKKLAENGGKVPESMRS